MSATYAYKTDDRVNYVTVSDYQRKRVYKAENMWMYRDTTDIPFRTFASVGEVKTFLNDVVNSAWMQAKYSQLLRVRFLLIRVDMRQGDKKSTANATNNTILLAPNWGFRMDVVLHEFAHIVAHNVAHTIETGHGRCFIRTHLLLVRHVLGVDAMISLARRYKEQGVQWFGEDVLFAQKRIAQHQQAVRLGSGLTVGYYSPTRTDITINGKAREKVRIHTFKCVKVAPKYVPSMKDNWSRGRYTEWAEFSMQINHEKHICYQESRYGTWAYFKHEDTWYKFCTTKGSNDGLFYIPTYGEVYAFLPNIAKNYTEEEMKILISEIGLKEWGS